MTKRKDNKDNQTGNPSGDHDGGGPIERAANDDRFGANSARRRELTERRQNDPGSLTEDEAKELATLEELGGVEDQRTGSGDNPPNDPAQSETAPVDPENTDRKETIDRTGEFNQVREDSDEREMEIEGLHKKGKRDYFVLNLTDDPDALCAIKAYGEAIRNSNPDLAIELLRRAGVNVGRG